MQSDDERTSDALLHASPPDADEMHLTWRFSERRCVEFVKAVHARLFTK